MFICKTKLTLLVNTKKQGRGSAATGATLTLRGDVTAVVTVTMAPTRTPAHNHVDTGATGMRLPGIGISLNKI